MRRALVACALIALCLPVLAFAGSRAPDDGVLVVRNGDGAVALVARGTVIGSCDVCSVTIDDPNPGDGPGPVVTGFDVVQELTRTKTRWTGTDFRFRSVGGFMRMVVRGTGIDLSVVAHGQGWVQGDGTLVDGTYALDGGDRHSLPDDKTPFWIGTPPDQTG